MSPTYGSRMHKDFKIEFVRHPSAVHLVLAYFRYDHPRMRKSSLLKMETGFRVFLGKKWVKQATVLEVIGIVKKTGVWGYCNHRSKRIKEIHYWLGSTPTGQVSLSLSSMRWPTLA